MYNLPLLPGRYYHLYNHAVGDENLFRQPDNYYFFLERYTRYILHIAHTYAYCLMPNHFHMLVRIRDAKELDTHFCHLKRTTNVPNAGLNYSTFIMQQFSNFCNSYAKAFNTHFGRKGALFIDYVRRKPVEDDAYFTTLLAYIHRNPVHHEFCRDAFDWPYSSLHAICSNKPTKLERTTVLHWFGGVEPYIRFHQQNMIIPKGEDWEFGGF